MSKKDIKYIFFFNSAAIIKNLLGIIRAKLTSLWFGVSGVGILGQIVSAFSVQSRTIDLGIYPLLINKIGKKKEREEYEKIYLFGIFVLGISNILFTSLMIVFRDELSYLLFNTEKYSNLVILIAFLNPVFSIGTLYETITRAEKRFRTLAIGQNLTSIVGVLTIVPALLFWGINGIIYNFFIFLSFNSFFFIYHLKNIVQILILNFEHLIYLLSVML